MQRILVTGANAGIGLALAKQLAADHGAHVLLGARNADKGAAAVEEVRAALARAGSKAGAVDLVVIDVASAESIASAAEAVKRDHLSEPGASLYAIVNNAGTGFSHGSGADVIIRTNLWGPKLVCDAFIPLLQPEGGRIVNVGSGAAPMYVAKQPAEVQKKLVDPEITWEEIEQLSLNTDSCSMGGYGLSKALLASYTMLLAREHPGLLCSTISPGFIDTAMTSGFGAKLTPEQGTVSIRHCLFADLPQSGWYFGSDAKRSPLHLPRDPGTPEFDGKL